ncbi:carbamoyl-phosphate synthase large subunit [Persephonella sp.]|uniref:carbamoyl-phosphate synthase large subunit n=1 Tax=Persephonella sp. TaxID=2060922 RepID=UPI00263068BE|nr:carbamoyl-phosphate synthase large subunit [Persephonella sp.]
MPKRTDISRILLIGSGPIVIGQAAEFDYSGTQGAKALKEEGYEVILVNSNPATIMTDPEVADKTYIEPLITPVIEKIIEKERPDALLPTLGGQTALNLAVDLYEKGILDKYNVQMIGANYEAIKKAEDRDLFKAAMERIGLQMPKSAVVKSIAEAMEVIEWIGFPVIIRPSFTLGGTGGSIAYNIDEFYPKVKAGLEASPVHEVLLEESVIGWKEFEMEVMRDKNDNCVIICSIENLDPMGVHTGDSVTIAPAMTLTDKEYQMLRDYSIAVIREIGVETGGSNVQFSQNPETGQFYVIEMNPRVSRSSALASKATGFPIAKIAAKLAIGYTLDELPNDITKETPASFEPTIDYVVTKIPRFDFAKFPETDPTLTTMMKSVGEVMAIGRTFKESIHKALRSLELGRYGFYMGLEKESDEKIKENIVRPNADRLWYIAEAFRRGMEVEEIHQLSHIDKWFLTQIKEIIDFEQQLAEKTLASITDEELEQAKQWGFSDRELARLLKTSEEKIRERRLKVSYKVVDTCAAEFKAYTPYFYSSYEKPFGRVTEEGEVVKLFDSENLEERGN